MDIKEKNQWVMFCHLSALVGILIPFCNIIVPAILWYMKKDQDGCIDQQGKEVINFQIFISIVGMSLYLIISVLSSFNIMVSSRFGSFGAMPICGLIGLVIISFSILGALKAKEGKSFTYPIPFRFLD